MLESIIPAAADVTKTGTPAPAGVTNTSTDAEATFKIKVTPRAGKLPPNGKLYFKLTSSYEGNEDISFMGTVHPDDETGKFVPNISGMPYVAGCRGDGLADSLAVAEITSSGATLEVGVFGYKIGVSGLNDDSASKMINYIKAISVEYAWVDEAV